MTIEGLKKLKKELKLTNAQLSQESGVPLGTVNKIFSGATKSPQYDSVEAIERAIKEAVQRVNGKYPNSGDFDLGAGVIREAQPAYGSCGTSAMDNHNKRFESERMELIDGVFYHMTLPDINHQILLSQIYLTIGGYIRQKGLCWHALVFPVAVRLNKDNFTVVQPDIIVLCDRKLNSQEGIDGAPDFIVEVTSPASRRLDSVKKMQKYADAGVREYWIVDSCTQKVVVYQFEIDGIPHIYTFDDCVTSGIMAGLEVDMRSIRLMLLENI